ncbi:cytochrome c oxidase assembly protein [Antrihabitans cavernicola]|uniref:Cytochrome c oxidase assembly protein n=1 Tax=Antrihabitans cavernicola TaxID=2495913 RepID=A0A5A7SAP6_9NOCA|nr:cytochrome c oxidase assembly protein [Spelaeibacter cavernicola]KAA0023220.1 cytochrome c oxidase assembly protein [Spelaeibacter cavernicola]
MTQLPALTFETAFTSWRWDWSTAVIVLALGIGYWRCNARAARRGEAVDGVRTACFLGLGLFVWILATMSFVGVYADILFWVRALQVLLLLFVVPFGFALGKPVTVLRNAGSPRLRDGVDRVIGSKAARIATYPVTTSIAMLATPWLLYLTRWYPAALEHEGIDIVTRIVLVAVGFGYFYSRLQADPVPRRFPQLISLVITIAETIGDGLLGVVIWLGPPIAAEYYAHIGRTWGPTSTTDQTIGAGVLWVLGDVLGLPFLLILMRTFSADERKKTAQIDSELDAEEEVAAPRESENVDSGPARLWWEDDPQLQERFRRR